MRRTLPSSSHAMASLASSSFAILASSSFANQASGSFPRRISCNNSLSNSDSKSQDSGKSLAGRREVLLGGLYGAAAAFAADRHVAVAKPIQPPDLTECKQAVVEEGTISIAVPCCPPLPSSIHDFVVHSGPVRVRQAAHLVNREYLRKYELAVKLMKALPADDPRNFLQQANVHCAYCDGAYDQVGVDPPVHLQVHQSWLFFPWHRMYLYFHERILGSLIGDETFSLPFWNWDSAPGMTLPSIYTSNVSSPLFNPNRNKDHFPPTLIDLDGGAEHFTNNQLIIHNYQIMYKQMISGAKSPKLFMGFPYKAGSSPSPGAGTIERIPHDTTHVWVGDPGLPFHRDMGNFYSAAQDPIFYAHHSNVDRMWAIWEDRRAAAGLSRAFTDRDFLDAAFLFYDENARLVKVRVGDCIDYTNKLGYEYQKVDVPWIHYPQQRKLRFGKRALQPAVDAVSFPLRLDKQVHLSVKRPQLGRSRKEKGEEEEVLSLHDIVLENPNLFVKFDVLINCEDAHQSVRASHSEFAGTFVNVPHKLAHGRTDGDDGKNALKTNLRLGITDLLEDLDAEHDDSITVTLVPRHNGHFVTVGGLKIEFEPCNGAD